MQPEIVEISNERLVTAWYEGNAKKDAPLVFFVHGAGGRSDQFRTLFPLFRKNCSLLYVDFVGHGKSEKPALGLEYYSGKNFLNDIVHVYNRYKQQSTRNLIISHSYGTALSVLAYPSIKETIHGMILIGTCKDLPPTAQHPILYLPCMILEWMRPLMRDPFLQKAYHSNTRTNNLELIEYEDSHAKNNPMYVMKNLAWGMTWPTTEDFQGIECPCLLIGGEEDKITPISNIEPLQDIIPNVEIVVIEGAAHFPMLENVEKTTECIQQFLSNNHLAELVSE